MTGSVIFQPLGKRVTSETGLNLLRLAQDAGVGIRSVCGGVGNCANCRVRVHGQHVSPLNGIELDNLYPWETDSGLRLACQVEILDGTGDIVVDIPPDSLSVEQRSQVEGEHGALDFQPAIRIHELQGTAPSVRDLRGDWERTLGDNCTWTASAPVIATLTPLLREHDWRARMVTEDREIVGFLPPDAKPLGFAADVGTTGLAAYLLDLETGETLAVAGTTNPQIAYGEDVMSRLTIVLRDPTSAQKLQTVLVDELNRLIGRLCAQVSVAPETIVAACAVGNTAMHHLLFGFPVDHLGLAPYVPSFASELSTPARDLGLHTHPGARLYSPPCIAGFVGADHVAMLLASELEKEQGARLYLDIGTNTEISLTMNGEHWCCSAASGPAFEGAHIEHGIRAADGAIERVAWQDGHLTWRTIGNLPPIGICGSGLVDCVAALAVNGVLTPSGALRRTSPLVQRVGTRSWVEVASASETRSGQPITLSRNDIGEVQMAKGAIRAGIKLLVETAGIEEAEIEQIVLAGAFGTYIDPESACAIGLIPPLPPERIRQVGNASGAGARRLLLNADERIRARELVRGVHYLELTTHPEFSDRFSQAVQLLADPWSESATSRGDV